MKLAEALLLRSKFPKKIKNLQSRIMANLKKQINAGNNTAAFTLYRL